MLRNKEFLFVFSFCICCDKVIFERTDETNLTVVALRAIYGRDIWRFFIDVVRKYAFSIQSQTIKIDFLYVQCEANIRRPGNQPEINYYARQVLTIITCGEEQYISGNTSHRNSYESLAVFCSRLRLFVSQKVEQFI